MALTKTHNRMIEGSSVNVLDYGASPSATASANATAIQAALDSGAARVFIPAGDYSIDTTLTVPGSTIVEGEGRFKSLLTITTDNVAVLVNGQQVLLSRFGVRTDLGSHSSNGIVIGSASKDCGRSMFEDLSIIGMGGSGLVCIHGNLQTFRNIYSINNGTHGIEFTKTSTVIDNIGHKIEGVCDLRGNGTDGLHIAAGTSVSDTEAPKCISANLIVAQSNGNFGVFLGSRNNNVIMYGENNTTQEVRLGSFSAGNTVTLVNGVGIQDNGTGNTVVGRKGGNFENLTITRQRFSGETTGGFEIANDDGNAGELIFRKNGTTNFEITASGSSSAQTLSFLHDQSNDLTIKTDGPIIPNDDSTHNLGSTSFAWEHIHGNSLRFVDGITAPSTISGFASLYVDTADGDLKIKFGDGTVKTIVTDT